MNSLCLLPPVRARNVGGYFLLRKTPLIPLRVLCQCLSGANYPDSTKPRHHMMSTFRELDWEEWKNGEHRKNSKAERMGVDGDDLGEVSHPGPDSDHSDSDDVDEG
jgi:hypothetical protein